MSRLKIKVKNNPSEIKELTNTLKALTGTLRELTDALEEITESIPDEDEEPSEEPGIPVEPLKVEKSEKIKGIDIPESLRKKTGKTLSFRHKDLVDFLGDTSADDMTSEEANQPLEDIEDPFGLTIDETVVKRISSSIEF